MPKVSFQHFGTKIIKNTLCRVMEPRHKISQGKTLVPPPSTTGCQTYEESKTGPVHNCAKMTSLVSIMHCILQEQLKCFKTQVAVAVWGIYIRRKSFFYFPWEH